MQSQLSVLLQADKTYLILIMISVKTILLFFSAAPLAVYSLDCDDFTVGDCNESKDGLIESNDRVSLLREEFIQDHS